MNIRSIAITFLTTCAIISGYAASFSVSNYPEIESYTGSDRMPASMPHWVFMADGSSYLARDGKRIVKYDTRSGKEIETVLDLTHTRETTIPDFESFELSPDGSKILLTCESSSVYRRSTVASHYVYEIRSRLLKPLSTEHAQQQSPLFSPDGRMVAFVADGNIYIKKLDYGHEVAVTTDGKKNEIINGIPDWTYEEEFTTTCSMTWAPDNLTLCFLKYDESKVPMFSFQLFEGACNKLPEYALYPGEFTYKYPVAGQPNSVVSLHSYNIETRATKKIQLPGSQIEYIPRIYYGPSADKLLVVTLNRDQTRMEIFSVNPRSTTAKSILVDQWTAWLNPTTYEDITLLDNFFVVNSSRSGYNHLYAYSYEGSLLRQITSGNYDVESYYGYDPVNKCHYYNSTQNGAINRTLVKVDEKNKITLLSPETGTATIAAKSPKMDYFVVNYNNVNTAPKYELKQSSGKTLRTVVDNSSYQARWTAAPKAEFFTMQSDGNTLNGYIIKPSGFDSSKRYPVIMSQYSGPGSQSVLNKWQIAAENYFARMGYVVVCVDGRGTGGRGRQFSDVVYRRLGYYESIDQIAAAKYAAQLPFVDASKIAIYGWSYGGYEAIMASTQPSSPYAAAVAVAPVTDWRYYDTVYAERYMLTPQQNPDGYKIASTFPLIPNRKCPLLIMTGTADDNVHAFNTIQYVSESEAQGMWPDMLVFPNMNHSINGCNARQVVYARLLNYLQSNM